MSTFKAWLTALVAVLATLAFSASPAFAESHPKIGEFSTSSNPNANPNGIAVEEATGDVYVAEIGTQTVSKFDVSGNPVNFTAGAGIGTNALTGIPAQSGKPAESFSFPELSGTPAAIAIDNSTDPSDPSRGDLYVTDVGHDVIDKFSPTGAYLSQITGPFEGNELRGLAVAANGDVQVFVGAIIVFDNSTTNNFIRQLSGLGGGSHSFAVDPTGDYYTLVESGYVYKYGSNIYQTFLGRADEGPGDVAVAVDPVSGHLYVDEQSSVAEWDTGGMDGEDQAPGSFETVPTAALVSSFGSPDLSRRLPGEVEQGGIAVNGSSGDIYVSNPANGKVYVFASTPPAVAAGAASNVSQTGATLQGSVDPRGVPITSCEFEYEKAPEAMRRNAYRFGVPATVFGHSIPCAQTAAQIGSGTSPVAVSADIGGLEAGVLYYFRLVGGNAGGTSPGEGMFATENSGFGIAGFADSFLNQDGTPDTQAGSHPYEMVTSFSFKTEARHLLANNTDSPYQFVPVGNAKDIIFDPPPGLIGDPNASEGKCTLRELGVSGGVLGSGGVDSCPSGSQVGTLFVETPSYGTGEYPLFNMVPPHGAGAQFGAHVIFPETFIDVGLQTGEQYPLQAESLDIPAIEPIYRIRTTLFGVLGKAQNRRPFITLPTACTAPLRSTISVDSYQDPGHFVTVSEPTRNSGGEPVRLTGCSQLTFPAAITVAPDVSDASSSSGLTVGVHVPQTAALNPEALGESAVRDTTVALPAGVAVNPAGADGLEACSEGLAGFTGFKEFNPEFEAGVKTFSFTSTPIEALQPGVSLCPNGSKIATVKIKTPLLPNALEGTVYLAEQNTNPFKSLIAMYMLVEDPVSGSTVKLAGEVRLCENTGEVVDGMSCQAPGQIITTFDNTPDLPFEDLELHFFGGERAPLTTPSHCGTYTTQASFTPWDGNGPVNTSSSFEITSGPNGGPCPGQSLPFDPELTGGTTSNQAGGVSPFTMTMSREDGQQNLQSVSLKMPPGLSGLLGGIELCGEARADAGTCGPNSLIGETIVSVGVGSEPFSVKGGKVYLTGPYKGAPFGLSIVNPAKAGPYDLGQVIVRAKIEVNPVTADLTVTSDNSGPYKIPTILDGIPLQIKHVNVTINRPGFTFNPTNCNPLSISGTLYSAEGGVGNVSLPFQATNCAVLGFKPMFKVSTSGKTSRAKGASLHVKLSYPKAPFGSQANIASVKVDLPKQLPSRLTTLQKACTAAQFQANPAGCPAASIVGQGKAITPLVPVPLEGPAYFVSYGGAKFPELVVVLQGFGITIDLHGETFISKAGITSSTFHTVPDQPVGSFELTLPQGKYSALAANGNLCKSKLAMPTAFVAQNGAEIHESTKIGVTGCPKHLKKKAKKAKVKKGGKRLKGRH